MLNNNTATHLINLIKTEVADLNNTNDNDAPQVYQAIYNYLNYAGGQTLTPGHLQHYRKILAIFQNPPKILAELPLAPADLLDFRQTQLLQEMQTLTLLWLQAASGNPIHTIDLDQLLQQAKQTFH